MECFRKNLIATLKKFQAKLMTLYQNLGEEETFQVAYINMLTELSENGLDYRTTGCQVCNPI